MDTITRGDLPRQWTRSAKYYPHIDVLIVRNGSGETVGVYDAKKLARSRLSMDDNTFLHLYGFQWDPPALLRERIEKHRKGRGENGPKRPDRAASRVRQHGGSVGADG